MPQHPPKRQPARAAAMTPSAVVAQQFGNAQAYADRAMPPAAAPAPMTPLEIAMGEVGTAVDELGQRLAYLEARLSSVLLPRPPMGHNADQAGTGHSPRSPALESLSGLAARVRMMTGGVDAVLNALEA